MASKFIYETDCKGGTDVRNPAIPAPPRGMRGASEVEHARRSRDAVAFFGRRNSESDFPGCSPFPYIPYYVEADMIRLQKTLNLIGFNSR